MSQLLQYVPGTSYFFGDSSEAAANAAAGATYQSLNNAAAKAAANQALDNAADMASLQKLYESLGRAMNAAEANKALKNAAVKEEANKALKNAAAVPMQSNRTRALMSVGIIPSLTKPKNAANKASKQGGGKRKTKRRGRGRK